MSLSSRHGSGIAAKTGSTSSGQANVFSFEQALNDKLHSTLVIKPIASKTVLHVTGSSTSNNFRESMCHLTSDETPDPKLQVASLLCNDETRTDASQTAYDSIIVQGMKEKNASFHPINKNLEKDIWIHSSQKRKVRWQMTLTCTHMRPSLDKLY
jgi:hypothetical protein